MGIDVKLGYYRGKLTSYEAIKHLYLAQKAGIGETNGERGYDLEIHNFKEASDVYYISVYWSKDNNPKTYEGIQKQPYLAYYPDYVELHNGEYKYGSWWIESLTGLKGRACSMKKMVPRHFDEDKLDEVLPKNRWVRYHESLDDHRMVYADDREEFDFPIYQNQKIKFDYNMMPIGELPTFPKYKVNRKKMNLIRKANADYPQYVEAMFKLLPKPLSTDWVNKAEEDRRNETLDKRYRNFLDLVWAECHTYRRGYQYGRDHYEIKLEYLLENIDAHLKRMHPEVLDKVQ